MTAAKKKNWYEAILFGVIILCSIAAGAIFTEVRLKLHDIHREIPTLINGEF